MYISCIVMFAEFPFFYIFDFSDQTKIKKSSLNNDMSLLGLLLFFSLNW